MNWVHEVVSTAVAVVAFVVMVAVTVAAIHWTWVAKEWLLRRLAARIGVPYETRRPFWTRRSP